MSSIGLGKIILLGEHAVVYGYPALAAALDRGVRIDAVATPAGGSLRVDIPSWNLKITAAPPHGADDAIPTASDDHPFADALAAIADSLDVGRPPLTLVGDAQIPPGQGLGASAAFAVAVARALLHHAKRPATVAAVTAAADASEQLLHGRASGVDVALSIAGGIGVFRKASGLRPLPPGPALRVIVGPSGSPRSTAQMIARVSQATEGIAEDARLHELGELSERGTHALLAGDLAGLGTAMNRAHELLAELGVSTPTLDGLCDVANKLGAFGAKLTGAGGGGSVIAIAPREREAEILAAWKTASVNGFVASVGARA
jgi:mevalonate kinase